MKILFALWLLVVMVRGVRDTFRLLGWIWRKLTGREYA